MSKNVKIAKVDVNFYNEITDIAKWRFFNKLDKKYSPQRVQRKMLKSQKWMPIKEELKTARFIDDERGQFTFNPFRIFQFVAGCLLAVLFIAGLLYSMGLITDIFTQAGLSNEVNANRTGYVNITSAVENTFGKVNQSAQALRLVAFAILFSEILIMLVLSAFQRVHPILFIAWIFIVFLGIMLSVPVSNAYETLLSSDIYGGNLNSFVGSNWILLNLPMVTLVLGILSGILMFINIVRSGDEQPL